MLVMHLRTTSASLITRPTWTAPVRGRIERLAGAMIDDETDSDSDTCSVMTAALAGAAWSVTASDILARVKAAEAGLRDFRAEMVIEDANKKSISGMGQGYGDITRLEKGVVSYKKPDRIRYDGYAQGIKVAYIQNGYVKLILAPMIRQKVDVKNAPGKRQDSLDVGFLSSRLWTDNVVKVVSTGKRRGPEAQLRPQVRRQ